MKIKIPQPDLTKINFDKIDILFEDQYFSSKQWLSFVTRNNTPKYKSWKEIKKSTHIPRGMNAEEAFYFLTFFRKTASKQTPIKNKEGKYFIWEELSRFRFFFEGFAKDFGTHISKSDIFGEKKDLQRKKIFEGIIDESIASSQMEGAIITREEGRKLLKSGRTPKTNSEKMVCNNYKTILKIENDWKHISMSEGLLLKIQESLTTKTLKERDHEGRLRKDSDNIVVGNKFSGDVAFIPPKEKSMRKELLRLLDFANDELETNEYFGDLPKAILLHFWIAYLHPFCDGNGRTARAIFYWYLLRNNYPYIGFLPLSTRIRKSKTSYEKAFLLTEQDNSNLTYFFDYIIRQMELSIKDFEEYEKELTKKFQRNADIQRKNKNINKRQAELLEYFISHSESYTTCTRHQMYQSVSHMTARKDLLSLQEEGFLSSQKKGREVWFFPTKKIVDIFSS